MFEALSNRWNGLSSAVNTKMKRLDDYINDNKKYEEATDIFLKWVAQQLTDSDIQYEPIKPQSLINQH